MSGRKESRVKAAWVQEIGQVVEQRGDGEVFKLVLRAPEIARRAVAGQFVEVRPVPAGSASLDPLLRRPFSLCEIRPEAGEISLIYRVVGRGTRALAAIGPGAGLDLLGPLGHSFPDPAAGSGRLLLVGGGLGIPPMAAAAEWAVARGREVSAILGARSARYLAGAEEVAASGVPVVTVTDDGSAGERAFVTQPLEQALAAGGVGEVWACGPEGMLVAVKERCAAAGVDCFVSVERFMACGFGACIGCTVPRAGAGGYLKTCQDGPVFAAEEVELGGF
ncbi:MAG: dihydroorotate dehydrogenase electron transfer subunit [Bacillota bacterium]